MLHATTHRAGQTSLIALIALPILLGALVLVIVLYRTRDSLTEIRNVGVAASLAGVEALADDVMLTGKPDRIRRVFEAARQSAAEVARQNVIEGRRPELTEDDFLFGTLDRAVGGRFVPFDPDPSRVDWGVVNAVEVTVRQPGKPSVFTRVTGVLDQEVIGFRPWDEKSAPVVPVALLVDKEDEHPGWNDSVQKNRDHWAFDRERKRFSPGSDGLPEVRVRVGRVPNGGTDDVCGFPIAIGTKRPSEVVEQVRSGLTAQTLAGHGFEGEFKLGEHHTLPLAGGPDLIGDGEAAERAFRELAAAAEPRVWPQFATLDDHGRAVLNGFVAARVVSVERDLLTRGFVLLLQPCVLATPTAVTDPGRADRLGKPVGNRTVVKVRLAG